MSLENEIISVQNSRDYPEVIVRWKCHELASLSVHETGRRISFKLSKLTYHGVGIVNPRSTFRRKKEALIVTASVRHKKQDLAAVGWPRARKSSILILYYGGAGSLQRKKQAAMEFWN